MSSLRASAATGVAWTAVQIWTVRLTTAGAFIILSRQLQPKEFGLVALAMAVIGVLSLFGDSGIPVYVQRVKEINQAILSTAFWTTLAMTTVLAGALAVLAGPVASLFDAPGLTPVLRWLSIGLFLNGLNSLPSAMLKREMRFKTLAVRGTIATLVGSVVAIAMALSGYGVWALVAQSVVRSGVSVVIIWTSTGWLPRFTWSRTHAREMISFGSQMLGISLMMTARDRGEDFLLAGIQGTSVLGLWAVANRMVRIIQEVGGGVVTAVATPAFSKLQDDRPRLYRAYSSSLAASGAILFPAFLLLAVTSRDLVPLVLGEQWTSTAPLAQLIALTTALVVFSYFDRPVFVATNQLKSEMLLVASSVTVHLAAVVIFAPMGLMPLALALLVRAVILIPTRMLALHRVTGMPWWAWVAGLRVLAAAVVMAGLVEAVSLLMADTGPVARSMVAFVAAAFLYPPLLWLCARPVVTSILKDVKGLRGRRRVAPLEVADDESRRPAGITT